MPLHVVLHEPEIPNNTGNIGRTCVAAGCMLHLIHPLGFDVDEKAVRRAGLDYWPRLRLAEHASWAAYLGASPADAPPRRWFFTTHAARSLYDADIRPGDHLVFGKESSGLPRSLTDAAPDACLRIPMAPNERSLNLSTSVGVAVFEGIRQLLARGDLALGPGLALSGPGSTPGA